MPGEYTPMLRAIDEHLALSLPGWGAPGGLFTSRADTMPCPARSPRQRRDITERTRHDTAQTFSGDDHA